MHYSEWVLWVSRCRERLDGFERSAVAYIEDSWQWVLPESVLREFFARTFSWPREVHDPSLYGLLKVSRQATGGEIRTAYRQQAKLVHPDVSNLPDAEARFRRLTEAYEILTKARERYDAGLQLSASLPEEGPAFTVPITCGVITIEGELIANPWQRQRWIIAESIIDWAPIRDFDGNVMVTRWDGTRPQEEWISKEASWWKGR